MTRSALALATSLALAAGPAVASPTVASPATYDLKNNAGAKSGTVTLTEAPKGVLIKVKATGLSAGWHGLHLHEKADCSKSDFTSAGGHFHAGAGDRVHGLLNPNANEAGDLPNLWAGADGVGKAEVFTTLTTLKALRDADGSAVVIHVAADDHMSQPIGGAGARVACAEVK